MSGKPLGPFCRAFRLPATDPGMTQGSECVCSVLLSWKYIQVSVIPVEEIQILGDFKGFRVLEVLAQLGILVHSRSFKLTRCWATDDQGLWAHITLLRNTGK